MREVTHTLSLKEVGVFIDHHDVKAFLHSLGCYVRNMCGAGVGGKPLLAD